MEIKLSDEQLRTLVTEALFEKLDPESVKKMVTDALGLLMVPEKDNYGGIRRPGRLQSAVEDALLKVARDVCTNEMANAEVKEKLASMVKEAITRVTDTERDKTVEHMASQLSKAMWELRER